jgi:uncharacterized protein (UPF0333 family)
MKVIKLAAGLAVGYVLGSRAGRDKYEQIVATARKAQSHPAVTQAQQKAKELLGATSTTETGADPVQTTAAIDSDRPDTQLTGATGSRPPRRRSSSTPATPAATIDPLA